MDKITIDRVPLFQSLPAEEIRFLANAFHRSEIASGTVLFQEGERGDRFFIILQGELEVFKAMGKGEDTVISIRKPGDFVGEMSMLMRDGLRTASVRTRTDVEVLGLSHEDLDSLLARRPSLAFEMIRELSLRLRDSNNAQIRDLEEKNKQLAAAYQDLQIAQAQLVEKEKLEHELAMARDIQESILPQHLPHIEGYDFGARMVPARAVGGDFFDLIALDQDRVGIAIGDVSDKGVPAAIFMALFSSLLRVEARRNAQPVAVLQRINDHLLEMNETGMFVTVIYGVLDKNSRKFKFARAGHEVPLQYTHLGESVPVQWSKGQPLCIFPSPAIDEQMITLHPGQTLFLYTDGVVDARDVEDQRFSLERLSGIVSKFPKLGGQELCDRVMAEVMEFQADDNQFDDMTMIVVDANEVGIKEISE
jgi:serine phosphatase RsbU (regulator of sigma subunit)